MAHQVEPPGTDLGSAASSGIHLKKYVPIATWLNVLGVPEYEHCFHEFSSVQDILHMSEGDIRDRGVKNSAHRARMISSLIKLRDKLNRRLKTSGGISSPYSSPPGSRDSTPPSLVDHPDYGTVHTYQTLQSAAGHRDSSNLDAVVEALSLYPWYHGGISRHHAEQLLQADGDFVLRMSTSKPGDFVLTCRWNGVALHFMVNRPATGGGYQFEEDIFDTIPQLLKHYVNHHKVVSLASGAIISCGIGRVALRHEPNNAGAKASPCRSTLQVRRSGSQPLLSAVDMVSAEKYSSCPSMAAEDLHGGRPVMRAGSEPVLSPPTNSMPKTNSFTATKSKRAMGGSNEDLLQTPPVKPSRVPTIKYRGDAQRPVVKIWNKELYEKEGEDYSDITQMSTASDMKKLENAASEESEDYDAPESLTPKVDVVAEQSEQNKMDISTDDSFYDVPELTKNNNSSEMTANSSFYNVPETSKINPNKFQIPKLTRDGITATVSAEEDSFYDVPEASKVNANDFKIPKSARDDVTSDVSDEASFYDVPEVSRVDQKDFNIPKSARDNLDTDRECDELPVKLPKVEVKLPVENESSQFHLPNYSSELLTPTNKPLEGSAITTMRALLLGTSAKDLAMHLTYNDACVLKMLETHDFGVGVRSGLEYAMLPQGHQLREDLLERCRCMQLFVATTILTCTKFTDRSKMIQKWIQVAKELYSMLGNLFGFAQIVTGLTLPQISQLRTTWQTLRRDTPTLHTLLNTVFIPTLTAHNTLSPPPRGIRHAPHGVCIPHLTPLLQLLSWQPGQLSVSWDGDMDEMLSHLATGRRLAQQAHLYSETAARTLDKFRATSTTADMLSTPTQQRLLWGARGVAVPATTRHAKFELILSALAQRAEPGSGGGGGGIESEL